MKIKNNLYRLQEIYGFTDETDAEQVVTSKKNNNFFLGFKFYIFYFYIIL